MTKTAKCTFCGGTGNILLMRSAFLSDGVNKTRCYICKGSGKSSYRMEREAVSHQAAMRAGRGL